MKIIKWIYILCIIILCLFQIINIIKFVYPSWNNNKNDISEFIIGRWVGEFPDENKNENFINRYEIEFYKPNIFLNAIYLNRYQIDFNDVYLLVLDCNESGIIQNNQVFYYTFTAEDQIKLTARRLDEWNLYKDGEDLKIYSSSGLIGNGHYERRPVIVWLLVSLLVGIIPIRIINFNYNYILVKNKKPVIKSGDDIPQVKPYLSLIRIFLNLILFCFGLLIAFYYWRVIPIWRIRLPWDGIISLEIGLSLIIFSVKIIKNKYIINKLYIFMLKSFGSFLFGFGLGIVFLSFMKITFIMYFGHYPEI